MRGNPGGGAAHHHRVHPVGAGAHFRPQAGRAELEVPAKAVGELGDSLRIGQQGPQACGRGGVGIMPGPLPGGGLQRCKFEGC